MTTPLLAFGICGGIAVGLMAFARSALAPDWDRWSRWVPEALLHRWVLGSFAILSLVLLFSLPFFLIGEPRVGLAGLGVVALLLATVGRDVVRWVLEDLADHVRERRGLFRHGDDCVVHDHYPG